VPRPVYFDTSVFLEIGAKGSKHAKNIRALLKELKAEKARIYTSIITIQEVAVLSYRRGKLARDDYGRVSEFARIVTISKDVALTAAKREAEIKDDAKSDVEDNRRRKWDCFHIAAAQQNNCSVLYTTDKRLLNRQKQLGIVDVKFSLPLPTGTRELDFSVKPASQPASPSP
jgi:predicted nucleic acid-binding protein